MRDFSADISRLKVSQAAKDLRALKRVPLPAFDRLQVIKYISRQSDVVSRGLLAECFSYAGPSVHRGADALVLWLIFEERVDFERFNSEAPSRVRDWWSELVLAAHDLPTAQVQMNPVSFDLPLYETSCIFVMSSDLHVNTKRAQLLAFVRHLPFCLGFDMYAAFHAHVQARLRNIRAR